MWESHWGGWLGPEVEFTTTIKTIEIYKCEDIDDLGSSDPLEVEEEAQDVFKEEESIVEEVNQSGTLHRLKQMQN